MTEPGTASLLIVLKDGGITVRHGQRPEIVLAELAYAPPGIWRRLWAALDALGIKHLNPADEAR